METVRIDEERFCRLGYRLVDLAAHHLYHARERPPYRPLPDDIQHALTSLRLPEQGQAPDELLAFFTEYILPYSTFGIGHPKGFGWIAAGPDPMAVLGSLLCAALNPNALGGDQSATYLELSVLRWLAELVGFPSTGSAGLLVSGGTQALLHCLLVALHSLAPWDTRRAGLQQAPTHFVVYASDQGHHSINSSLEVLGLGQRALHLIESDQGFRLDVSALRTAIQQDRRAGFQPLCVVASAGTTNTGAIDPLNDLADLCKQERLWLHVDGASGAFGVLDPRVSERYRGLERVDSLSLDGHKWLGIPYECGCFFIRQQHHLYATFAAEPPDYLNSLGPLRFSDRSYQLSRAFHALKLWMMLASTGKRQIADRVERHNTLARTLAGMIDASPDFQCLAPVELSTVCFRHVPAVSCEDETRLDALNKEIMRIVQQESDTFLSGTVLRGRFVLRACIVHAETTEEDLSCLLQSIRRAAASLSAQERKASVLVST
jgi:glutamate/tyrosine decarboxylase-like PLP-dependent enzyme